ncbi:hypothetical protein CYY_003604 [Polysphondylium violaceum]|uniref:RNA polymerase II subunit A C-terminal domain phosphatase n=1 Tax=Polysphondylium violaceum TaxID=133409 RepID=A0A8J4PZF3_9MYCE|nr:hypothetical protein CYY_003604 [Polysphondylium violaceum]
MNSITLEYPFEKPGYIDSWRVSQGDRIESGQVLGTFITNDKLDEYRFISKYDGNVKAILIDSKSKTLISPGDQLLSIDYCSHDIQFKGLCATCGRVLAEKENDNSFSILHGHSHLTVSHKEAQRIENINAKRLLDNRKLSLVLDLDHTVIHAVTEHGLNSVPHWRNIDREKSGIHNIIVNGPMVYCIKKRPHLYKFLKKVNELFELHIYTMGTRNYATQIAKLIDPSQILFKERILSRDDSVGMNFKTLQRLFPCDDSMVIIVDDRSDVWKKSRNLIQVSPYVYFTDVIDSLHHEKQPLLLQQQKEKEEKERMEKDKQQQDKEPQQLEEDIKNVEEEIQQDKQETSGDEKYDSDSKDSQGGDDDGHHLEVILEKLIKIHKLFYEAIDRQEKPHVANILDGIKQELFNSVNLVMSGVYPLNTPPHRQPLRLQAEEFGAKVQNDITPQTTHVVAAKKGTTKVNRALSKGLKVVNPQWIVESTRVWSKLDEDLFPVPSDNQDEMEQSGNANANDNTDTTSTAVNESLHIDQDALKAAFDDIEQELELEDGESDSSGSSLNSSSDENDDDDNDKELDEEESAGSVEEGNKDDDEELLSDSNNSNSNSNNTTNLKKRKRAASDVSHSSNGSNGSSLNGDDDNSSSSISNIDGDNDNDNDDLLDDSELTNLLEEELDKLI